MTDSSAKKPFYVTTAILYANASPHVGHTFELIGADVVARAKRMLGYDVFFQTGTDEHGQKMLEYAERAGKDPKAYADDIAPGHRKLWDALDISYDQFIRTTDDDHYAAVDAFWKASAAKGDIYKDKYDGWYCVTDENFVLESQVTTRPDQPDKKFCPECGNELTFKSEESYFFRWSKYQGFMEQWLQDNPRFIEPKFRANEMINSFLKPGLQDISISRSSIKWGIPVPGDPEHVIYVWFDALINYITGVGYGTDQERFDRYWPADLHVVGKDILKFHTLLWPAMCESAGIAPPRHVFGHGFVSPRAILTAEDGPAQLKDTIRWEEREGGLKVFDGDVLVGMVNKSAATDGDSIESIGAAIIDSLGDKVLRLAKMSKSRGNIVDPVAVTAMHGGNPDPLRFFLLREIDFGGDGIYSDEALLATYNADLADKLGNLLSRTLTMVDKYQGGIATRPAAYTEEDNAVREVLCSLFEKTDDPTGTTDNPAYTQYESLLDQCKFGAILERVLIGAQRLNLYITETRPFTLAKDPEQTERLQAILYVLVEGIRLLSVQLYPFIPGTAEKIWQQVGGQGSIGDHPFEELKQWGHLDNARITRGENLFPKAEK